MKIPTSEEWIRALRSGEYTQTTDVLCRLKQYTDDVQGFCCLGVLCDLAEIPYDNRGETRYYQKIMIRKDEPVREAECEMYGTLPTSLFGVVLGIERSGEGYEDIFIERVRGTCIKMNDNGDSFAAIADFVENSLADYWRDEK